MNVYTYSNRSDVLKSLLSWYQIHLDDVTEDVNGIATYRQCVKRGKPNVVTIRAPFTDMI